MVTCCCMPGGYVPQRVSLSRACFSCHKGLDCSCSLRGSLSPASGNSQEAPVPHTLEREEPDPTLRPHKHFPATSSIGGLWPCLRSSQVRYERFLQLMTPQVGRVISVTTCSTVVEGSIPPRAPCSWLPGVLSSTTRLRIRLEACHQINEVQSFMDICLCKASNKQLVPPGLSIPDSDCRVESWR